MATISPQSEGRDEALSSLTTSIEVLNLAEQNSSIQPAKTVFGSAGGLLARIKVRFPHCDDEFLVHVYLGFDSRRTRVRVRQARPILRRCMSSSRPGVERERNG